mgnify:CR=1 FL=1
MDRPCFFLQAEDGIRDLVRSRGLGDVYKRQILTFILPLPVGLIVWVLGLVFAIMGALAANKGEAYRYPFSLRLVK